MFYNYPIQLTTSYRNTYDRRVETFRGNPQYFMDSGIEAGWNQLLDILGACWLLYHRDVFEYFYRNYGIVPAIILVDDSSVSTVGKYYLVFELPDTVDIVKITADIRNIPGCGEDQRTYGAARSADDEEALMREWAAMAGDDEPPVIDNTADAMATEWEAMLGGGDDDNDGLDINYFGRDADTVDALASEWEALLTGFETQAQINTLLGTT